MRIDKSQLEAGDRVEFVHKNLPPQLKGKIFTVYHGPRFLRPEKEYFSLFTYNDSDYQSLRFLNLRGRHFETCNQCQDQDIAEHGGGPGFPFNVRLPSDYGIKLISTVKKLIWV